LLPASDEIAAVESAVVTNWRRVMSFIMAGFLLGSKDARGRGANGGNSSIKAQVNVCRKGAIGGGPRYDHCEKRRKENLASRRSLSGAGS
jgi:hypothetical protein